MLDKIQYTDHSILDLNYQEGAYQPNAGGSLTYNVERKREIDIPTEKEIIEKFEVTENEWIFFDYVNVLIDAFNTDTEDSAFKFRATIEVMYHFPIEIKNKLTPTFFKKQDWFFSNYSHQIAHDLVTSVLTHTKYKFIINAIPRFRGK